MKRIAKFEKVSLEEFMKDWCDTFELDASDADTRREIEGIYGSIELPKRATVGSAGYDFFAPLTLNMKPGETVKVPTGIRCKIEEGWVLKCYPRSGLGFKYRLQLDNMFRISKDLYKAYQLKQQFEHVKESSSREEAAKRLSRWIMDAQKSGLMEFIKVSFTYQNWSKEILNSFEYPYTNGYIEGCNNRIKVLKRISFGMPRFVRFRRRIMHIMLN